MQRQLSERNNQHDLGLDDTFLFQDWRDSGSTCRDEAESAESIWVLLIRHHTRSRNQPLHLTSQKKFIKKYRNGRSAMGMGNGT